VWGKIIIGDSRSMEEVKDSTVDLVVTSPPYWHIKDYGVSGQIGYGESLHDYLRNLYYVWMDCYRILRSGSRLCINVGDQFARSVIYGRYKVIPIHAEFIAQCEDIGFDFMGSIIWQKRTTMKTTGGATIMGSFPYPPNGIVEIDYEFIHIFRKPGKCKRVSKKVKEASRLSTEEWKEYFSGHWRFGGARQVGHEAMFPEELPKRLIRMFTFRGDIVLDPFLGSGTTLRVALGLERNAIGYEINEAFLDLIKEKAGLGNDLLGLYDVEITKRERATIELPTIRYTPRIQDARPLRDPQAFGEPHRKLHRVTKIVDAETLELDSGHVVKFLGVRVKRKPETLAYLKDKLLRRVVYTEPELNDIDAGKAVSVYLYLKNRIFVNGYLVKSGLGIPDPATDHPLKEKFETLAEQGVGRE